MDKIICVKLTNGEEIVGNCLKEYTEGDLRMARVLAIVDAEEQGQFLDKFLLGGSLEEVLEIRAHSIITHCSASPDLIDLYSESILHYEKAKSEQSKPN